MNLVEFLAAPFILCLILAGIHCYLGLHVLARGVIFVDLSLAQVSALGAAFAALIGIELHTPGSYGMSLVFTLLASLLFALARRQEHRFSQEALIGILYAFSSAAAILCMDRLPHGSERVKDLLVGRLLWVTWPELYLTASVYFLVGLVHFVFRNEFLALSFDKGNKFSIGWDFLFYALFGVVITSSVRLAGVLLVFTYLVVPAFLSAIFFSRIRARLLFGWAFGALSSFAGLALSSWLDLPSGAFVVACCAFVPILLVLTLSFVDKRQA